MIPFLLMPAACSAPPTEPGSDAPPPLFIKLFRTTRDRQYTLFEVSKQGELSFGGGRDAMSRVAKPVGPLTVEERQRLWDMMTRYDLTSLPNRTFAKYERVAYEVKIKADGMGCSYRAIDDEAADLEHLHEALFGMYTERTYKLPQFSSPSTEDK